MNEYKELSGEEIICLLKYVSEADQSTRNEMCDRMEKIMCTEWDLQFSDMVDAVIRNDVFGVITSITGWSLQSLMEKANIIPDCRNGDFTHQTEENLQETPILFPEIPVDAMATNSEKMMKIRLFQINSSRDSKLLRFMNFENTKMFAGCSEIDAQIYDLVFEGEVDCHSLEDVYMTFNTCIPENFTGRSMSVSDVLQVVASKYVEEGFYFCDSVGFEQLPEKNTFSQI